MRVGLLLRFAGLISSHEPPCKQLRHGRCLILHAKNYSQESGGSKITLNSAKNDPMMILKGLKEGSRASLAKAITLIETQHPQKKLQAEKLVEEILSEHSERNRKSFRIGMSGPPGAGKSTFIEVLGKYLTAREHKVAVLAVDPSSSTSGGSLLGDKTRMPDLSVDPRAFIRPSPARGHLGGVTRSTNEAVILCEYAGYDIVIIETVGVGQSEYAVSQMVDMFVLLLPPGGGDELQGVKRGIVERADVLVVTKADGDLVSAAQRAQYEYVSALKFMRAPSPLWKPKVIQVSARTKEGLHNFWDIVCKYRQSTESEFERKRGEQRVCWMWDHIDEGVKDILLHELKLHKLTLSLEAHVRSGRMSPGTAADTVLNTFKSIVNKI